MWLDWEVDKKNYLLKLTIFWKFHPFQWSFKVSCRAAGPISCTLGARGLVCDQLISTSSLHVLPAPFVYPKQKSFLHLSPCPLICQLGIATSTFVLGLILMCSGNSAMRLQKFFDHWQVMSYVMNIQGNMIPISTERIKKPMLQYLIVQFYVRNKIHLKSKTHYFFPSWRSPAPFFLYEGMSWADD